jgi:hypothetical protein
VKFQIEGHISSSNNNCNLFPAQLYPLVNNLRQKVQFIEGKYGGEGWLLVRTKQDVRTLAKSTKVQCRLSAVK